MWRMAETRVIRKYANRRLYDATDSRHVTLEDIRKLIAGGERIKVVDDRSGVDLTRCVLLQIIYEQEQLGAPLLGMDLLEGLIRSYGSPTQHMLARLMEQSVETALQSQQNAAAAAALPEVHE